MIESKTTNTVQSGDSLLMLFAIVCCHHFFLLLFSFILFYCPIRIRRNVNVATEYTFVKKWKTTMPAISTIKSINLHFAWRMLPLYISASSSCFGPTFSALTFLEVYYGEKKEWKPAEHDPERISEKDSWMNFPLTCSLFSIAYHLYSAFVLFINLAGFISVAPRERTKKITSKYTSIHNNDLGKKKRERKKRESCFLFQHLKHSFHNNIFITFSFLDIYVYYIIMIIIFFLVGFFDNTFWNVFLFV